MEIKVTCRSEKDPTTGKDIWTIEAPGPMYVRERRVVWSFEGLAPGIVPLLAFKENPPHGPFSDAWLTASTIAAELDELPGKLTAYDYDIVLVQWNPDQSPVVAHLTHSLSLEARAVVPIKVSWHRDQNRIHIEPESLTVGAAQPVEWQFEIPEDVFATVDFGSPDRGERLRPIGPFAELHGRRAGGAYRLTGQTDLVKDGYKYTVTLYDRKSGQVVIREDPKIDNNGDPIG